MGMKGNQNAKGNKGGGRKSLWKPEYVRMAEGIAVLGATDKQLATIFGVSERTIHGWKKEHPEFFAALKKGKAEADNRVKQALFKRAIGCHVPDTDIRVIEGEIVKTPLEKHYPPDTTACIIWLQNRDSENWKPRKAVEDDGKESPQPIININMPDSDKGE
jgi:hypothetical protein